MRQLLKLFVIVLSATTMVGLLAPAHAAEKREDIIKLFEITEVSKLMDQVISTTLPQISEVIRAANPSIPKRVLDELDKLGLAEFKRSQPEFLEVMVRLYETHFAHQEIEDLLAFYETPTGKKMIKVMPQLMQESMALGLAWGRSVGERVKERMFKEARRRGYSL